MTSDTTGSTVRVARLLEARIGIAVDSEAGGALQKALEQRAAALGSSSLAEYERRLTNPDDPEFARLVNAVTIPYSWFYRDGEQLEVIAKLLTGLAAERGPLDVWVPGCAGGEDPYTLSMLARRERLTAEILGTDVNVEVLAAAEAGVYGPWTLRELPAALASGVERRGPERFGVASEIRNQVRFSKHNLLDPPVVAPNARGWDLIFCRNVLIYFRAERARAVVGGLAASLAPGGCLILGPSEVLAVEHPLLEPQYFGSRVALRRRLQPAPTPSPAWKMPVTSSGVGSDRGAARETPMVRGPSDARARSTSPVPSPSRSSPADAVTSFDSREAATRRGRSDGSTALDLREPAARGGPADRAMPLDLREESSGGTSAASAAVPALSDADALLDQRRFADARALLTSHLELHPLDVEARLLQGMSCYLGGELPEAVNALRAALFLDATAWPAAHYLALAYDTLGLHEEAQRSYAQVVEAAQGGWQAQRARELVKLTEWKDEAVKLARRRLARGRAT